MILRNIIQTFLGLVVNRQPHVASKGPGRWTIRHWDSIGRCWIDDSQTFFNKHQAKRRLKQIRESLKRQAS